MANGKFASLEKYRAFIDACCKTCTEYGNPTKRAHVDGIRCVTAYMLARAMAGEKGARLPDEINPVVGVCARYKPKAKPQTKTAGAQVAGQVDVFNLLKG